MVRRLLIPLLMLVTASCQNDTWRAGISDYGIYRSVEGVAIPNEKVAGGMAEILSKRLVQRTDRVEASIGTDFGFRYVIEGPRPYVTVTIRVTHPSPLKDPDTGREFATSEWTQTITTHGVHWNTGWKFDKEWMIVPGEWTIALFVDKDELLRKTFTVTDARRKS